jgi:hypothetical protein
MNKTFATVSLPATTSSRVNDLRFLDAALDNVYKIFGESAVLVPASEKAVSKMYEDAPDISHEQSMEPAHQTRLTRECIGVVCGPRTGLYTIYCQTEDILKYFLADNECLKESLITSGPIGYAVWVRCADVVGKLVIEKGFPNWIGTSVVCVVADRVPMNPAYQVIHLASPLTVDFQSIVWPTCMQHNLTLALMELASGSPFIQSPQRRSMPNWDYWARCFQRINQIYYDQARESFYRKLPDKKIELLSDLKVLQLLANLVNALSRHPKYALLGKFRSTKNLKELLAMLRIVSFLNLSEEDDLERFLQETIEPCRGESVSSAELETTHQQYFQSQQLPPYPATVFEKRIPDYIERMFRGGRSRKLQRHGRYCRGYTHVRLRPRRFK